MRDSNLLSSVIIVAPVDDIPPERRISLTALNPLDLANFHRNTAIAWYRQAYWGDTALVIRQVEAGMTALTGELLRRLLHQAPQASEGSPAAAATAQARAPAMDLKQQAVPPAVPAKSTPPQRQTVPRRRYRGVEM